MPENEKPLVGILMGSASDWPTMKAASETLAEFGVAHECRALSAHRTPAAVMDFCSKAEERGMCVLIGAAGGAAHLAGVMAAHTLLPVLGVPMPSAINGVDSLLSTVQMPGGAFRSVLLPSAKPALRTPPFSQSQSSRSRIRISRENWRNSAKNRRKKSCPRRSNSA
jgi:phosphoribosylaminoimidazole carboxylase PurE protein